MSTIPLYDALVKLGIQNKDAREVVDELPVAKNVATKEDLANLETKLGEKMYKTSSSSTRHILTGVGLMLAAASLLLTAVGLAIKFL